MQNRAQLNLVFTDNELYEGLILAAKASRELGPLVISLLTLYFYNVSVRDMVDGYTLDQIRDGVTVDGGGFVDEEQRKRFEEIRMCLSEMDFTVSDINQQVLNGVDVFSEYASGGVSDGGVSASGGAEVSVSEVKSSMDVMGSKLDMILDMLGQVLSDSGRENLALNVPSDEVCSDGAVSDSAVISVGAPMETVGVSEGASVVDNRVPVIDSVPIIPLVVSGGVNSDVSEEPSRGTGQDSGGKNKAMLASLGLG